MNIENMNYSYILSFFECQHFVRDSVGIVLARNLRGEKAIQQV